MKKTFGILAHPVSHSLSPQMQSAAFEEKGIDAEFLRFDVLPENLEDFMKKVRSEHIDGLAVSLPHKETIIQYLDKITEETAQKIKAVNTVFWEGDTLVGDNTDAEGFWRAVEPWIMGPQGGTQGSRSKEQEVKMSQEQYSTFNIQHSLSAAVLGAGGAARAITFALRNKGIDVNIFNRSLDSAQILADECNATASLLKDFSADAFQLVVNATSVGLKTNDTPILADSWGDFSGVAFDAVFDPRETRFLSDAKSAGAKIITGENMLLFQGMKQFKIWTGLDAPEEVMRNTLMPAAEER